MQVVKTSDPSNESVSASIELIIIIKDGRLDKEMERKTDKKTETKEN